MLVPEATVDEYDFSTTWKRQIRTARQVPSVKTKTVPKRMEQAADREFRLGVGPTNPRHHRGPLPARNYVHRVTPPRGRSFAIAPLCGDIYARRRSVTRRLDHNFNVLAKRGERHQKPLKRDPLQFVVPDCGHLWLCHPEELGSLPLTQALRLEDLVQFLCEPLLGLPVVGDASVASITAPRVNRIRECFVGQIGADYI